MSPQWHETLAQVWAVWRGADQAGRLEMVCGYQSPGIAGLTARRGGTWSHSLTPNDKAVLHIAFLLINWASVVAHTSRLALRGGAGREVWRRQPRGRRDPTCRGASWAPWRIQLRQQQGPSPPSPSLVRGRGLPVHHPGLVPTTSSNGPLPFWLWDMCIWLFNFFWCFP